MNVEHRRKSAPPLLCPLHLPHVLTWDRTFATAVGNRLSYGAVLHPSCSCRIVFRYVHVRGLCDMYQRFRGIYYLYLQGR
jgi:hypothetical protein